MIGVIVAATALVAGTVGYIAGRVKKPSIGSARGTGLGATGIPRGGIPKSSSQRLATHKQKYGEGSPLPPRGSGLKKRGF